MHVDEVDDVDYTLLMLIDDDRVDVFSLVLFPMGLVKRILLIDPLTTVEDVGFDHDLVE